MVCLFMQKTFETEYFKHVYTKSLHKKCLQMLDWAIELFPEATYYYEKAMILSSVEEKRNLFLFSFLFVRCGRQTSKPPFPTNQSLGVWTARMWSMKWLDRCILWTRIFRLIGWDEKDMWRRVVEGICEEDAFFGTRAYHDTTRVVCHRWHHDWLEKIVSVSGQCLMKFFCSWNFSVRGITGK